MLQCFNAGMLEIADSAKLMQECLVVQLMWNNTSPFTLLPSPLKLPDLLQPHGKGNFIVIKGIFNGFVKFNSFQYI